MNKYQKKTQVQHTLPANNSHIKDVTQLKTKTNIYLYYFNIIMHYDYAWFIFLSYPLNIHKRIEKQFL